MIYLDQVSKNYTTTTVLNAITLHIDSGTSVAITGPSGSGKSTLLSLIAGIDFASAGTIRIMDTTITELSETELAKFRSKHVGFVFQFHHLLGDFTLLENIALPLLIHGASKKVAYAKAQALLERINLHNRATHFVSELSGGERQRGAILRAVITEPKIIIADEPTGNLDETNSELAINLLLDLAKECNTTIIIATHNKDIAGKLDEHYSLTKRILCKQ